MTAPSAANAAPPIEPPKARSLAARWSGAALLAFLAGGLATTVTAVVTQRLDLLPHALTRAAFLDGASMRDMAQALANAPFARVAAERERELSWLAISDLGPQVREGCPGWLFLAEELAPQVDGDRYLRDRARAVVEIQAALRQRGIRLMVAVVPDKSRIETQRLCELDRSLALEGRLRGFVSRLAAAGVPVVDTTPALKTLQDRGEDPFLRTDTHWTENAADAAARAVADVARSLGLELSPQQNWDVVRGMPARRPGDLVRLAGLDGLPLSLQPVPEEASDSSFTLRKPDAAVAAASSAASAEAELFGDADLPQVALIGTSFSRTSHFAEFLAAALQTPVGNFAKDGGNFWGSPSAYFASDAFRQTPPKLIVWEMPERVLQLPRGQERWALP
ncbi:alginate O-acetyltransferase AlgX-related protein [Xylophilus sp. GOD-11R]|uniref:alginate O-acetyltransferase AlgX-related protein n=1 Tax=Xylophilus sp. GOD-11R TaxID=3089814 RepID=UPI00298C915E|nr:cell division protein FtsQ [Xylophilus sp. GOD-11R]WPB56941.1 cell division protein FtsQ [Xylophilus sp. GOD-11R]